MAISFVSLESTLRQMLGRHLQSITVALGEVTIAVKSADYLECMTLLQSHPDLHFESLIDLAGVDYSAYKAGEWEGSRFAVICHLLSITHNWRLRVRAFAMNDEFPVLPSLTGLWSSASWYEREAFDFFGILFEGHPDLRRILTDYGFIGHPFRKDFPVSGYMEMHYDEQQKRVIYQRVTIEPREIVPRIIREERYGMK